MLLKVKLQVTEDVYFTIQKLFPENQLRLPQVIPNTSLDFVLLISWQKFKTAHEQVLRILILKGCKFSQKNYLIKLHPGVLKIFSRIAHDIMMGGPPPGNKVKPLCNLHFAWICRDAPHLPLFHCIFKLLKGNFLIYAWY